MTNVEAPSPAEYSFGSFRLLRDQRVLLKGEKSVRLGGRAHEILAALVERPGVVVTKDELFARVWPRQFVEEGNLKFHVAALRKALGDGQGGNRFIANIPGRGYCFVAPVASSERKVPESGTKVLSAKLGRLPAPLTRIVGRSDAIMALATRLPQDRFITIVGPGGIGKTTVAVAVADTLVATFNDGVCFVDLGPIADPSHIASAVAASLGVAAQLENATHGLISFLREKQILIVLDNCEHMIEKVAAFADEIFRSARDTSILATSREPLRAEGEHVHHLAPLAAPPPSPELTAAQALAFPAVQLFVERAASSQDTFELTDADAPVVAELCRGLDGIALAIEIVAGRVDTFSVAQLASGLDDRLRLLMRGRRTSQTRHQTLSATLDWSYQLLPGAERATLRGLAIFAGVFTWNSASAVLTKDDADLPEVFDSIANLVAKSLVSATVQNGVSLYRLLDTTRAYALLKLQESGERNDLARRHAQHFLAALARAHVEWHRRSAADWLGAYWHAIDNVRAALDWAFSPSGDASIGVALTEAAVPLWFQLSLMSECCERVERALSALSANPDPRREMQLRAALAWSLMQTMGSNQARPVWTAVLGLAERLGDIDYQLRSLWGVWAAKLNNGQLKDALATAERFYSLAGKSADLNDPLVGDRMVGYILHLLGQQGSARQRLERMLAHYVVPSTGPRIIRFVFDQRATARSLLARILWLQGFPDQANRAAQSAVDEARASSDMLTVCQVLVQAACPISILRGDFHQLESLVALLLDYSRRNALRFWRAWGLCFKSVQIIKSGDPGDGLVQLRRAMEELREIQYGVYYIVFLCEYAEALGLSGQPEQGLVAIDEAIARSQRNEENWYIAELLRVKGELTLQRGGKSAVAEAMEHFQLSGERSRQQGTLSWELRTAISIARLPSGVEHAKAHWNLLRTVYDKFTEGHASADLILARRLLAEAPRDRLGLPIAKLHLGRRMRRRAGSAPAQGLPSIPSGAPPNSGRRADHDREDSGEMALVGEAAIERDLRDRKLG
jgi:predicted ATPase/DNA-binding winged helix-turn-helix (wHTH) protein